MAVVNSELGRKGFLSGGMVKVIPSNGGAGVSQAADKGLRVVCGASAGYLKYGFMV